MVLVSDTSQPRSIAMIDRQSAIMDVDGGGYSEREWSAKWRINCRGGMRGLTVGDLEEHCWGWWGREGVEEERRVGGGNGGLGRKEALVYKSAGRRFPRTRRS